VTASLTFVEFVQPVRSQSNRAKVLAAMYWLEQVERESPVSSAQIRTALVKAKIPAAAKINVSDVLAKAESRVEWSADTKSPWKLTDTGREYVRADLGLEVAQESALDGGADSIRAVLGGIGDQVAQSYVEEAVLCLEAGALRASVVFVWSGGMRTLQDSAMSFGVVAIEAALQKHDARVKFKKFEDFAGARDTVQLLAFRELAMVDKGEWATLQEGLDLRNRCGHPTKYTPGAAKVRAFIEDVVGIIF